MKEIKDLAASVHARLLQRARQTGRPFQELLEHFGMERFLYRLSRSTHVDRFVLKGALMLRVWDAPAARPTRDIDLMGYVENSLENLAQVVRDLCLLGVEPDGVRFDPDSVVASRIKKDADYQGVRVCFEAFLGRAKFPMQIDVGFGDRLIPSPAVVVYPSLLDFPAPHIRGYSRETTIAEKFEAMVTLGSMNSRMKDFFDIWYLAGHFDFDGSILAQAISATFGNRGIAVDPEPVAWTHAFTEDAATMTMWSAFIRRSRIEGAPPKLSAVVELVAEFLRPVAMACRGGAPFGYRWSSGGPWKP